MIEAPRNDCRTPADESIGSNARSAVLVLGVTSLLSQGLLPLLLGSLHTAHRLTASGIGVSAFLEALAITLCAGCAGYWLPARHLRVYAGVSVLVLAASAFATCWIDSEGLILTSRLLAGAPEGLLFWVAVGMIARSDQSERWAAILVTGSNVVALLGAATLSAYIIPEFGVNGGFVLLGTLTASSGIAAVFIPDSYPPVGRETVGVIKAEGWSALFAAMLYTAAGMGVFIYLVPLADAAGHNSEVAGTAVTGLLAGQLVGSVAAVWVAGRLGYVTVLLASGLVCLFIWPLFALRLPGWTFVGASALMGTVTFFSIPFLYPLTVAADESRQTALQAGPAQMLGSAIGPLVAAFGVSRGGPVGLLSLSSGMLLAAAVLIVGVHHQVRRRNVDRSTLLQ